jgi:hypothetical protein
MSGERVVKTWGSARLARINDATVKRREHGLLIRVVEDQRDVTL